MELSCLLALPSGLEVADVSASDELLTVRLKACAPTGICPLCARAATHVRSYYTRLVADVHRYADELRDALHILSLALFPVTYPSFSERRHFAMRTQGSFDDVHSLGLPVSLEVNSCITGIYCYIFEYATLQIVDAISRNVRSCGAGLLLLRSVTVMVYLRVGAGQSCASKD